MSQPLVALIMFSAVFGGALLGLWLQKVLPDQHLASETKEVVRLATALIATITALVLGLLFDLAPVGARQQGLQAHAVELNADINMTRALIHAQREDSIPAALLVVLGAWLSIIFATFGLFAPRNTVVVGALLACALSASGAVFLILEMNSPFTGLITLSSAAMHDALLYLGR